MSGVTLVPDGFAINFSVARVLDSDSMFRKGDWPSCTEIACFKVSSKTGSPDVLLKSARTMVSLSVSLGRDRMRQMVTLPTIAASTTKPSNVFHARLWVRTVADGAVAEPSGTAALVEIRPDS